MGNETIPSVSCYFHRNVCALMRHWFEDAPADEIVDLMSDYVLASGSWGRIETKVRSITIRDGQNLPGVSGELVYICRKLFPPAKILEKKYTVLQKAPWLLPVVWLVRPFYKLFCERKSLETQKRELNAVDKASLDLHHEMLRKMGIDYRF